MERLVFARRTYQYRSSVINANNMCIFHRCYYYPVADLEGAEPVPTPLWATDRSRHGQILIVLLWICVSEYSK